MFHVLFIFLLSCLSLQFLLVHQIDKNNLNLQSYTLVLASLAFSNSTTHRGGWKIIIDKLDQGEVVRNNFPELNLLFNKRKPTKVLVIDCLEEWFGWGNHSIINEPWIGISHLSLSYEVPSFIKNATFHTLDSILSSSRFILSSHMCLGIIVLSEGYAVQVQKKLVSIGLDRLPVCPAVHPFGVEDSIVKFSLQDDLGKIFSNTSSLVFLGQQYRRIATFHSIRSQRHKIWLPSRNDTEYLNQVVDKNLIFENVRKDLSIDIVHFENFKDYDRTIKENIVIVDFWSAIANNAILEAIAFEVPFLIKRLPSTEEYLGQYPLFFESANHLQSLLDDTRKLKTLMIKAHEHLRDMDKSKFSVEHFKQQLHKCTIDFIKKQDDNILIKIIDK
jgi:hypothetical protein